MSQATTQTDERTLHPDTTMDAVSLRVGDLEAMSAYYERAFAFTPIEERTRASEVHRVLGRGSTPMLRLIHTPDLPAVDPRQPGLYHTAFLFDDEAGLAATVSRAAREPRTRFAGAADHLVSEAFYFTDPEGNGVELYRDRPRDQWTYRNGQVEMGVIALDPRAYLREHLTEEAMAAAPRTAGRVGHVHLQVGDIATARAFYVDALGFAPTLSGYPGALFASAGGYHHHVAMNVWHSAGAGPRAASLGLGDVAIAVPTRADLDALTARLRGRGIAFTDDGRSVRTTDPWGTQVTVTTGMLEVETLLDR